MYLFISLERALLTVVSVLFLLFLREVCMFSAPWAAFLTTLMVVTFLKYGSRIYNWANKLAPCDTYLLHKENLRLSALNHQLVFENNNLRQSLATISKAVEKYLDDDYGYMTAGNHYSLN